MGKRNDLERIARMLGQAMEDDDAAAALAGSLAPLLADGAAVAEIIAGLLVEARRKSPSADAMHGYAAMLQLALDGLRIAANGGDRDARKAIAMARDMLARGLAAGGVPASLPMVVARAFARAQLEPGPALQQAALGALEAKSAALPLPSATDLTATFAALAAACDNDPFAFQAEMAASLAALPLDRRMAMVGYTAMSDAAALREAALGFAFAPEPEMTEAALAAVAAPASAAPVSSVLLERLVRMRPWFAQRRQAAIDAAVRALRPKAVTPVARPRPEIRSVVASLCDGAGAQSLFMAVRQGKRFALACLMLKLEHGVADAFVNRDLSKGECEGMLDQLCGEMDAREVSLAFCEHRLAAALARNVARDAPPPFGLLDVVETIGCGPLHPAVTSAAGLAAALVAELPNPQAGEAATHAAHRASAGWPDAFAMIGSWFEAGDQVDALLGPIKKRKQRVDAVLQHILPVSRAGWAERCAWIAAVMKDEADAAPDTWIPFALVARDLASDRPLPDMPLARRIAEATVDAFAAAG